jgi:hypothetical protein
MWLCQSGRKLSHCLAAYKESFILKDYYLECQAGVQGVIDGMIWKHPGGADAMGASRMMCRPLQAVRAGELINKASPF